MTAMTEREKLRQRLRGMGVQAIYVEWVEKSLDTEERLTSVNRMLDAIDEGDYEDITDEG